MGQAYLGVFLNKALGGKQVTSSSTFPPCILYALLPFLEIFPFLWLNIISVLPLNIFPKATEITVTAQVKATSGQSRDFSSSFHRISLPTPQP